MCYDLVGFKALLKLDADYAMCRELRRRLEDVVVHQRRALKRKDEAIQKKDAILESCQAESQRVFDLWKDENRKRHEAEQAPRWGTWLSWGVAAVMTASTATLVTVMVLDE